MNVGLIVGHTRGRRGAVSYNGVTEYDFNSFVATSIQSIHQYKVFNEIHKFDYVREVDRNKGWPAVEGQLSKFDCGVSIELHFNSFFKKGASGVEVLCLKDDAASLAFSRKLASSISKAYGSRLRRDNGVLEVIQGDNGFENLSIARCSGAEISVLVEPDFLSHKTETSTDIINNPLKYANIIYNAIESLFGDDGDDG